MEVLPKFLILSLGKASPYVRKEFLDGACKSSWVQRPWPPSSLLCGLHDAPTSFLALVCSKFLDMCSDCIFFPLGSSARSLGECLEDGLLRVPI